MNQLKAGAALSYLTIVLNIVVGLIYTPFMLRMLGQSEFGLYSLAASVIAYLTVLDLGFGNAIVRYTSKFRAEGKTNEQYEMFGMFFIMYLIISLVAFVTAMYLVWNVESLFGTHMNDTEVGELRVMLILMSFNLAFTFPMSIWGSIITAYENFVFMRVVSVVRTLANPAVMVVLLCMGYKAVAMVVVLTVFNVLTLMLNWYYCRSKLKIQIRFGKFRWSFLKEVSIYSFWIFLNAIMDRIYWSTGQFVLGIYRGAAVVGIYAVAIQLQNMYMMFSTAISSVFLPKVTAMVARGNDREEISDLFIRTGRIQYIVMALILSGFIVFGKDFIHVWAGPGYEDAYTITLLFFIPLTVPLIQNLGIVIHQARNEMKFRSVLYIVIAIGCLVFSIPMAKAYGGIGCAIATSAALTLGQILIMNVYYQRKQGLDILKFWREIGKMTIAPAIVSVVAIGLMRSSNLEFGSIPVLGCAILVFMLVYIPAFWAGSMNKSERQLFSAPVSRIYHKIRG